MEKVKMLIAKRDNATDEEIEAMLSSYFNDPGFEYRGGHGGLCHQGKVFSGYNFLNAERKQYVSIEIDRPYEPGRGSTVVRLYISATS